MRKKVSKDKLKDCKSFSSLIELGIRCFRCRGDLHARKVTCIVTEQDGYPGKVVIRGVSVYACAFCGANYITPEVKKKLLKSIEKVIENPDRYDSIPMYVVSYEEGIHEGRA